MATLIENTPSSIQFVNADGTKERPTLSVQAGDWEVNDHTESGIVFDTYGEQAPILTPADARKLAKWLNRAADLLDGVKHHNNDKKNKTRHHYEADDEDDITDYRR